MLSGPVELSFLAFTILVAVLSSTSVFAFVDRIHAARQLPIAFGRVIAVMMIGIGLYVAQGMLLVELQDARVTGTGGPQPIATWLVIATAAALAGMLYADEVGAQRHTRFQLALVLAFFAVIHQVGVIGRLPMPWEPSLLLPSVLAWAGACLLAIPVTGIFVGRARERRSPWGAGTVIGVAGSLPFAIATLLVYADLPPPSAELAMQFGRGSWFAVILGFLVSLHAVGWMLAFQVTRRSAMAGREIRMLQASVDALLHDSPDWFGVLDERGRLLARGGSWPGGDDTTVRVGDAFAEEIPDEAAASVREAIAEARSLPGRASERELRFTATGQPATERVVALRVVDRTADAGVRGFVVVARDRTEEDAARRELERRRDFYRHSFERVPLAMFVMDAATNEIIDANPAASALYGYERDALIGSSADRLVVDPSSEAVRRFRTSMDEGGAAHADVVVEHRRADGTTFTGRSIGARILDPGGLQRLVMIEDVSETLRADRLRASEVALLEALVRSESDEAFGLATVRWLADRGAGVFQLAALWLDGETPRASQLGAPAEVAASILDARTRAAVDALAVGSSAALDVGAERLWACAVRDALGRAVGVVAVGPAGSDVPGEEVAALLDVAARLVAFAAERQLGAAALRRADRLETLGRVTGGVAHDFNNLLTVIIGETDLLREHAGLDDEAIEHVDGIAESARRASTIARRLNAMSRNQPRHEEAVDLTSLVDAASDWLGPLVGDGVQLQTRTGEEALRVQTDRALLEAALLNLAINARDAQQGRGTLTLEARAEHLSEPLDLRSGTLPPGPWVVITLADEGPGIEAEALARVLDPFFTTRPGAGTGLGLPMVANFASESGGAFHIANRQALGDGEGVVASIWLPRMAAQPDATNEGTGSEGASVLLVEDEALVARFITRTLERAGYAVEHVDTADEARARFEAGQRADLVLSDVILPGELDGIMLARWLHEAHPEQRVLLSSGYAIDGLPEGLGVRMLPKPYDAAALLAAVEEVIVEARRA